MEMGENCFLKLDVVLPHLQLGLGEYLCIWPKSSENLTKLTYQNIWYNM